MSRISAIFDKLLGRKGNGASAPQAETQAEMAAGKQAELKKEEGDPEEQETDEDDSARP